MDYCLSFILVLLILIRLLSFLLNTLLTISTVAHCTYFFSFEIDIDCHSPIPHTLRLSSKSSSLLRRCIILRRRLRRRYLAEASLRRSSLVYLRSHSED